MCYDKCCHIDRLAQMGFAFQPRRTLSVGRPIGQVAGSNPFASRSLLRYVFILLPLMMSTTTMKASMELKSGQSRE